ncbi:DMT family transporter [Pseudomonas chlororaphis]|uniref:DMT family transporter n=1 Tax=Pseudomonas chlororaphis TaxID=587753 RepID=A0AB34C5L3_9PSED|nr:DMT family transporter [Pseudomonas chlororaphis]KAA5841764.1 DMT family transporter [Pseudomonas chlororaphis]
MDSHVAQQRFLLLILSSTFLQGSSFVASKIVLSELPPLWLAALRFFVAALSLLPWLWLRHRARVAAGTAVPVKAMPWLRLTIIGLLQTTGVMAFLTMGLTQTSASKAAILMASNPLVVALLAGILLKERVRPLAWLGLLLAFAGVVVCIGVQSVMTGAIGAAEALVMAGSTCWALATLASKRFRLAVDTWTLAFWQMLIGAVTLALLAAWRGESFSLPAQTMLAFLWLAIPASTGAMGLWFAALHTGGAVRTSGFLFLCPFFAALITFAISGDMLSTHEMLGGVMIAVGIVLLSRTPAARPASHSSSRETSS